MLSVLQWYEKASKSCGYVSGLGLVYCLSWDVDEEYSPTGSLTFQIKDNSKNKRTQSHYNFMEKSSDRI